MQAQITKAVLSAVRTVFLLGIYTHATIAHATLAHPTIAHPTLGAHPFLDQSTMQYTGAAKPAASPPPPGGAGAVPKRRLEPGAPPSRLSRACRGRTLPRATTTAT